MLEDCFSLPSEFALFGYLPVSGRAEEDIWQIDKLYNLYNEYNRLIILDTVM